MNDTLACQIFTVKLDDEITCSLVIAAVGLLVALLISLSAALAYSRKKFKNRYLQLKGSNDVELTKASKKYNNSDEVKENDSTLNEVPSVEQNVTYDQSSLKENTTVQRNGTSKEKTKQKTCSVTHGSTSFSEPPNLQKQASISEIEDETEQVAIEVVQENAYAEVEENGSSVPIQPRESITFMQEIPSEKPLLQHQGNFASHYIQSDVILARKSAGSLDNEVGAAVAKAESYDCLYAAEISDTGTNYDKVILPGPSSVKAKPEKSFSITEECDLSANYDMVTMPEDEDTEDVERSFSVTGSSENPPPLPPPFIGSDDEEDVQLNENIYDVPENM